MFLELLVYYETVPVQYINTGLENQNISEYYDVSCSIHNYTYWKVVLNRLLLHTNLNNF